MSQPKTTATGARFGAVTGDRGEYHLLGLAAGQYVLTVEKAGFREFGRRRESKLMGGRLWDQIYMEALASEFISPLLARLFVPDQPHPPAPSPSRGEGE